jgi:hypothetical protein
MIAIIKRKIRDLHWGHWLGLFGMGLLFVALRWNNFNAPFISDEGEIDYSARLLIQGIAPYQHAFVQKPPGAIYSYALAHLLLPNYFWSPRLLAYVFVALATLLLGLISWLEFGEGVALPAMWLMTPMVLLPGVQEFSCNPEMFLMFPLLATLAVYAYSRQNGHQNVHWFAAGFLAGVTFIYKYNALPILAFMFVIWLLEFYKAGSGASAIVKALLSCMAGGILALALGLAFYLFHHALGSVWECTIVFNRYYAACGIFSFASLGSNFKMFWSNWWILFFLPLAVFLRPPPRILFWTGVFICAVFTTTGSVYPQYYILIMPFWALLAALGIRALASQMSGWMTKPIPWLAGLIAVVVVLLVVYPDVVWMRCSPQRFVQVANEGYPFTEAELVGDKLSHMTSPNDFVYIAGSEPEILCYAQRFSPTRFITSYPLMIPSPLALGYQRAAIQDLKAHPPQMVVFVSSAASWIRHAQSPPDFFAFLNDFLPRHYEMVGGYVKTNEQNGDWSEPLTNEQFKNSSLLLFKLKPD